MTANFARDWPYPRLIAHRGAGLQAPENTLTAMRVGHAHDDAVSECFLGAIDVICRLLQKFGFL